MLTESQASVSNFSGEKLPDVEMSTSDTSSSGQASVPSTSQISSSSKTRPPISILPDDPEETESESYNWVGARTIS